jgi:O-antigen ligase
LRWWSGFAVASLLLPPLPYALGNTGPHLALVFAALGVWIGVVRLREWRIRIDLVTALLAVFTAWLAATSLFAVFYSGVAAAGGSLARVGLFGIGVFAYCFVRHGPGMGGQSDHFRWASAGFALASASALWACLDFYFQFPPPSGFAEQFVWLPFGIYRRAQGVFYDAGMLGNLCSLFLTAAAVAFVQPGVRKRVASGYGFPLGVMALAAALVLSFSRSSLLNLVAALVALAVLERQQIRWLRSLAFAAAAIAATSSAIYVWMPEILVAYWRRTSDTLLFGTTLTSEVLSGRLETWHTLVEHLADRPWVLLTGIGYKTLPYTSYFGEPLVADNMYLSILTEAGVAGLVLMVALSAAMLTASLQAWRRADSASHFFGAWFFCFWVGQMAQMLWVDVLTYWRVLPLAFFVLAMAELGGKDVE